MNARLRLAPIFLALALAPALAVADGSAAAAPQTPRAVAGGGPAQGGCELYTGKQARPTSVVVGQEVEITLRLDGRCLASTEGGPADVVLAVDRSSSMLEEDRWSQTVAAAESFLNLVDYSRTHVGIVTFSGNLSFLEAEAELEVPLTADQAALVAGLRGIAEPLPVTLWTNLTVAIESSREELESSRARPDARKVIVLLTDGDHNALIGPSPVTTAQEAKDAGILIITIGLSVNDGAADRLEDMATEGYFYRAPTTAELQEIYGLIAQTILAVSINNLRVIDILPEEVEYVLGSANPEPTTLEAKRIVWSIPVLTQTGWSASYRVRPLVPGTYATNKTAYVEYREPGGASQVASFPVPAITVRPRPSFLVYLPQALSGHCKADRPFDVALAIDTSSSMWGAKVEQALLASREFLRLLDMPRSQAAIVAFNEDATVVQGLTGDRPTALAALDRLPRGEGTRIDRAIAAASTVLRSPEHRAGNLPVLVLLTDGMQGPDTETAVLDAAARARGNGVVLFTVGIGPDVSRDLLLLVAGSQDRYYEATQPEELERIYRSIAGALPCEVPES